MKNVTKLLLLLLCAVMLFSFFTACTGTTPPEDDDDPAQVPPEDGDDDGSEDNKDDGTEDDTLTSEQKFWRAALNDVSAYQIIRSADLDGNPRLMTQALRYALQSVSGKQIKVYSDINVDPKPKEIIVGVTERLGDSYTSEIVDSQLAADGYKLEYIGEAVIIHYGGFEGLALAVKEIIGYICEPSGKDADALYNNATAYAGVNPGDITLTNIYENGMIFQQNKPAVIKGSGTAGYVITAALHNSKNEKVAEARGTVGEDGKWKISLDGQAGSYEAYTVKFSVAGIPVHTLSNILFGEVWITTGQSNMLYKLSKDVEYKSLTLGDKYLKVLSISKPKTDGGYSATPMDDNENPSVGWVKEANFAASTNAVSYFYASKLRQELDVPVGVIQYAVGGVPVRSWLSEETIKSDSELFEFYKTKGYYVTEENWVADNNSRKNASAFYNTMTCLIEDLSIAGVVWYQGEQDEEEDAADSLAGRESTYLRELELLYAQFAEGFGFKADEMPFIYTLLVPYRSSLPVYFGEFTADFATFAQGKENVSAISIYDQSPFYDADNTADHPNSKRLAGERMANAALAISYGVKAPASSPYPIKFERQGSALIVTFENVADGLMIHSPLGDTAELRGFTVCGADGVYVMAKAEIISNNQIKVYSPYVSEPISVTYAYEINQRNCNLGCGLDSKIYNMAVPFCLGEPENAKHTSYFYWMSCDIEKLFRIYSNYSYELPLWVDCTPEASGAQITLSHNTETKYGGSASLSVAHTGSGIFGVGVTSTYKLKTTLGTNERDITYNDTYEDISSFSKLAFYVRNNGSGAVTLTGVTLEGYSAAIHTDSDITTVIANDGQWYRVVVDLNSLTSGGASYTSDMLTKVDDISVMFESEAGGVILIDEFELIP